MDSIDDYLKKKASQLGLERGDQLGEIQAYLDEQYPGQCRAVSINDGVLKITTPNASVASELRLAQRRILSYLQRGNPTLKTFHITIR
jgi:hypothetical protein